MITNSNRLLIIALDGCEVNLVEEFNCRNLMQKEYGKLSIPKECFIPVDAPDGSDQKLWEPYTPLVWRSFITGNAKKFQYWKFVLLSKIPLNQKLGRLLQRFSFKYRLGGDKRDRIDSTIFDLAKNPVDIDVPTYSIGWSIFLGLSPKDFSTFSQFIEAAIAKGVTRFQKNYGKLIGQLKRNTSDLIMFYAKLLDTIGHLKFQESSTLQRYYRMCDRTVYNIKRIFDGVILIVSDHGICSWEGTPWGKHSDYAFYSTNMPLHLKNLSITDFYNIIKGILQK